MKSHFFMEKIMYFALLCALFTVTEGCHNKHSVTDTYEEVGDDSCTLHKLSILDTFLLACLEDVTKSQCFNYKDYYIMDIRRNDMSKNEYEIKIEEFVYDSASALSTSKYITIENKLFFVRGNISGLFSISRLDCDNLSFSSEDDYCEPPDDYNFLLCGKVGEYCDILSKSCME